MNVLANAPAFPTADNQSYGVTLRTYLLAHEQLDIPDISQLHGEALIGPMPKDMPGQIYWWLKLRAYIRVAQVDALIAQLENHAPASPPLESSSAEKLLALQRTIIADMPKFLHSRVKFIAADPGPVNPRGQRDVWEWYAYEVRPAFNGRFWEGSTAYTLQTTPAIPGITPDRTLTEISKL